MYAMYGTGCDGLAVSHCLRSSSSALLSLSLGMGLEKSNSSYGYSRPFETFQLSHVG